MNQFYQIVQNSFFIPGVGGDGEFIRTGSFLLQKLEDNFEKGGGGEMRPSASKS